MKRGYLLILVAGCGFKAAATGSAPAIDAALPVPDGGTPVELTFDTAADFTPAGYATQNLTVDPRGSLTPNAYLYGGLVGHGAQGLTLWSQTNIDWALLAGKTAMATGAGLWRGDALSGNALGYLGITNGGTMTMWFEGEVYLQAGSNETFQLTGDDVAFFQIAPPGTTSFTASSDKNNMAVAVDTPATGWYPIRIGHTNASGGNSLSFTHSDNGGLQAAWTRDRIRGRASELTGALRTVFFHQILGGGQVVSGTTEEPPIAHFEESPLLAMTNFPTPALQGVGSANTDWSARYAAQVHITTPGAYTLTVTSDDGDRARLGTMTAQSHWARADGTNMASSAPTATLAAGWNDLTVDYNEVDQGLELHVQIAGPDFANPIEVPRAELRPVEAADDRLAFSADDNSHSIADGGGAGNAGTAQLMVAGAAGKTVSAIDVTFQMNSPHGDQIAVDLETPAGTRITIRGATGGTPNGDQVFQVPIPAGSAGVLGTLLGGAANGLWKLDVYDTVANGGASTLESAKLTLHTTGGLDNIARTSQWTSPILDQTTNVIAIDDAELDTLAPTGTAVNLSVRTCQQADCSDSASFLPIIPATAYGVPPGRYLQLRVDLTSDGALVPELQKLGVSFRVQ
ncbi:MAG TPA: proprotein convertase P-domain-containing protein [Kofleriaceae bacterium]|nr:proprotein convertase P-domain-containing protein [Kofleriaceae bacterium]